MVMLIVPALTNWQYPDAFSVYLQRDDGELNLTWLQTTPERGFLSLKWVRRFKRSRILTQGKAQDLGNNSNRSHQDEVRNTFQHGYLRMDLRTYQVPWTPRSQLRGANLILRFCLSWPTLSIKVYL